MAPTHIAFGVFSTTSLFSLFSLSLHKDLPALGAAMLGSLLPDIDSPKSALGRLLPFVSIPLEQSVGHRTVTHGLLAAGALGLVLLPLGLYRGTMYAALLIGYVSHLLADCATKSGVPLFYPHPSICMVPKNSRYRVQTGSLAEQGVLLVLLLLLGLVFPVSSLGGTWRAIRYVMATPSAAYSDYREATTEALLDFKGRWRVSRQPVEGKALILDATSSHFLIAYEGQVWVYGEQGDILPDRSRVQATGQPIRLDTLRLQEASFPQGVTDLPSGAFLSGKLHASRPYELQVPEELPQGEHVWLKATGEALELSFAPQPLLARLYPVARIDSAQVQQARQQLQETERELAALELRRPPVHYLRLREVETKLAEKRRHLAELQDSTVRFSGRLLLRLPGGKQP